MSDARLPISCWDTGKVSRDKINDSFNDLVTTVQWYEPTIVGWYWYIWGTATWVKAVWDNVEMKVDDWCIWYKSSSVNNWTSIIAIEDLKWDKWDTGDAATVCVGTVCTGAAWSDVCVTNSGTCHAAVLNFTIPQWATWCTGDTWARIYSAKFCGNDIVFTETNGCKVTIVWGKTEIKGDQWCPWCNGCNWQDWQDWADWASICAAAFSGDDIVFTRDDSCTVTLANAKTCLKWADWVSATVSVGTTTTGWAGTCACVTNTGTCSAAVLDFVIPTGAEWPAWNGICCVTTSKSGKTTTVCMEYTSWEPTVFCVQDWADWAGSGDMCSNTYDPCCCMADAFDYCNLYNTPTPLTAGTNIDITCAKVSAENYYIITENDVCVTNTPTLWVAPYNICYCYTNICINPDTWIKWKEGSIYSFVVNSSMIVSSNYRNVRVKIWDGDYIPVMWTSAVVAWCTYFQKAQMRQYQYSTKYQCDWALHLFTDSNTTYSSMSAAEATTWTCTCARTITAATLKCAIDDRWYTTCTGTLTDSSLKTVNGCCLVGSWDICIQWWVTSVNGCTGAVCLSIPTDNCELANSCGYTTCTGTLVAADLNGYAQTNSLCTVATSGKYCDLTGSPALCTVATSWKYCDLTGSPTLCTVATSWKYCDLTWQPTIPTDNCQLANSCWYTTCTGTLVASDLNNYAKCCDIPSVSWLVQESCIACINGCCLTQWWDICIQWGWGDWIQLAPNSEYDVKYHWYWPQACYEALSQYYTCCANDTAYFTI